MEGHDVDEEHEGEGAAGADADPGGDGGVGEEVDEEGDDVVDEVHVGDDEGECGAFEEGAGDFGDVDAADGAAEKECDAHTESEFKEACDGVDVEEAGGAGGPGVAVAVGEVEGFGEEDGGDGEGEGEG